MWMLLNGDAPDDADYHDMLARTHLRAGRLDDAEAAARQAIELAPDNARYHDTLALVLNDAARIDALPPRPMNRSKQSPK